jgi:hypothetical protein
MLIYKLNKKLDPGKKLALIMIPAAALNLYIVFDLLVRFGGL